ncbi:uncharacterized protein F5Z01DRAFT_217857 [Emericellopsis atlantica]|uniref:Uncharacterized protein n=1 Tax=Emericellopsis atlantica TaxID=2614577 RepID=A0A9P7ZIC7_9HYPO|nr:uncharacterized protein F5Z01DRAFT_217857 [Emericellopsis atlantica]KAG9252580.1 hypothetical protein F5Z01DRAFT_217857 [Emericellopsis atlantica]
MEDEIQSSITQDIFELLALYGINDCSHEPVRQHILGIANFVRESRLKAGINGAPARLAKQTCWHPQAPTDQIRGSYRIHSNAEKRGRTDYTGLDGPSKKTRTKEEFAAPVENSHTNHRTTIPDQSSSAEERMVSDAAALTHVEETHQITGSLAQREAELATTSSLETSPSTRAPTDHLTNYTSCRQTAADPGTGQASRVACSTLLYPPLLPKSFGSNLAAEAMKAIETTLLDCARLNYTLGRYGHTSKEVTVTTRIEKIRIFAEQLAGLKYDDAVNAVKREQGIVAGKDIQARWNETIYWDIITNGAKFLDPTKLRTAKGRLDNFSMAEKVATERFMAEAGYGTSWANQRRCRRLWKSLSDMRKAGIDRILFYRTKEFDSFCKKYPEDAETSLVKTVLSWENAYERLKVPEPEASWNSARNPWHSDAEAADFESSFGSIEASGEQLGGLFDIHIASGEKRNGGNRNKSIFVSLLPRDENSLLVCPIITVQEGDFLGVFAGRIRYSEHFDTTYGIPGPKEKGNLWLDYSHVTGALNLMGVTQQDSDANVHLQWELCNEQVGNELCRAWRVSVRALRTIKPFEGIVRVAPHKKQYLLHQGSACARRGYMRAGGP